MRSITRDEIVAKFIRTIDARWRPESKKKGPNEFESDSYLFLYTIELLVVVMERVEEGNDE